MGQYGLMGSSDNIAAIIAVACALALAGYLSGGINSAIIISKLKYNDDIRKHGSGNAGMTNMLRTYGKLAALLTLTGDALKTFLPCILGTVFLGNTGAFIAGSFTVIGHIWPVWFRFKGGKGVLAFFAMMLYCSPDVFLIMFTIMFIIVAFTRYISLGSVMAALLYPLVLSRFIGTVGVVPLVLIVGVIIVIKHKDNIKRLLDGNENKLSFGKSGEGIPKWLAITGSVVLILAIIAMLLFKMMYYNGAYERNRDAVTCGETKLSELQLRILYLDEKEDGGKTDQEAMRKALVRANEMLVLNRAAVDSGYSISQDGSKYLETYATEVLVNSEDWKDGDTPETYLRRKYGRGVKYEDYIAIIRAEVFSSEYAEVIGEDKANELILNEDDDIYITVNEKIKNLIINKY